MDSIIRQAECGSHSRASIEALYLQTRRYKRRPIFASNDRVFLALANALLRLEDPIVVLIRRATVVEEDSYFHFDREYYRPHQTFYLPKDHEYYLGNGLRIEHFLSSLKVLDEIFVIFDLKFEFESCYLVNEISGEFEELSASRYACDSEKLGARFIEIPRESMFRDSQLAEFQQLGKSTFTIDDPDFFDRRKCLHARVSRHSSSELEAREAKLTLNVFYEDCDPMTLEATSVTPAHELEELLLLDFSAGIHWSIAPILWRRLNRVYQILPGWITDNSNEKPSWFGLEEDGDCYLDCWIEPSGLLFEGILERDDWLEWESAFATLSTICLGFEVTNAELCHWTQTEFYL